MAGQYYINSTPALINAETSLNYGFKTPVEAWENAVQYFQDELDGIRKQFATAQAELEKAKATPKVYYVLRRKSTGLLAAKTGGWTDDIFAAKLYSAKGVENRGIEYLRVDVSLDGAK